MREKIKIPTCSGCSAYLLFGEHLPKNQYGVLLKPGERYCLGKKKAVHFSAKDPKVYPPKWCPKRKTPCEVRVYGFKSVRDWALHNALCRDLGRNISPSASIYCVEEECTTELTPKQFWDGLEEQLYSDLLPVRVYNHWIIEIDDGLKPVCFYKTEAGFEIAPFFDTARARENRKEE